MLSIVKTLRLSEALLQEIKAECTACNLRFSDFMRDAAVAALNRDLAKGRTSSSDIVPFGTER